MSDLRMKFKKIGKKDLKILRDINSNMLLDPSTKRQLIKEYFDLKIEQHKSCIELNEKALDVARTALANAIKIGNRKAKKALEKIIKDLEKQNALLYNDVLSAGGKFD